MSHRKDFVINIVQLVSSAIIKNPKKVGAHAGCAIQLGSANKKPGEKNYSKYLVLRSLYGGYCERHTSRDKKIVQDLNILGGSY